jgi:uncharacterized coiled-coil protein SlyX
MSAPERTLNGKGLETRALCEEMIDRSVVGCASHYYQTGKIISQAPSSRASVNLRPPQAGSFIIEVVVGATGAILAAPVILYLNQVFSQWLPGGSEADKARVKGLESQLAVQSERLDGLQRALEHRQKLDELTAEVREVRNFIAENQIEHDVLRSITSTSFNDIYRPIGRLADYALIYGNLPGAYTGVADQETVNQLETEIRDDHISEVFATVDAFARRSKRGTAFSKALGRGFRFHYGQMGKLGEEDDFSWSQFRQRPVRMTGRFYYFFDGSIKRLEVTAVERIEHRDD